MTLVSILTGIILISIIMIFHELGHFVTARLLRFRIEEFSLFMGPVLFEREKNGIKYNIKALPIGASVSFAGEQEIIEGQTGEIKYDPDDPGLFHNRPRWARALVVAMGPIVNLITAFLVFVILFAWTGAVSTDLQAPPQDSLAAKYAIEAGDELISINGSRIRTDMDYSMATMFTQSDEDLVLEVKKANGEVKHIVMEPEVAETRWMVGIVAAERSDGDFEIVSVDPMSNQGNPVLQVGDIVLTIDNIAYGEGDQIRELIAEKAGGVVEVSVVRDGQSMSIETSPTQLDVYRNPGLILTLKNDFGSALGTAVHYPWSIIRATGRGLSMLFRGEVSVQDSLAGPIGIVSMVGDVVKQKQPIGIIIQQLMMYLGLLSVAIGATNLLPIPPFDGNHLVVLAIEGSRRKDLPERVKHAISYIGVFVVLALLALVLFVDLGRIFGF
ncbi:MAG TPA: RIP metalloprotease RseP [Clostridiaceae bacterium]|nr:RIP metalloprotease RseP [Clostridiaceae bacterium]